jgi:hypothetical protein
MLSVRDKDDLWNLLLAAVVMGAIILWPQRKGKEDLSSTENHGQKTKGKRDSADTGKAPSKHSQPQDEAHKTAELRYWRRQNSIAFGGLVLSALTLLGLFGTAYIASQALYESRRSADEAHGQADAARNANQILLDSQRPWMGFSGHIQIVLPLTFDGFGAHVKVGIPIKNGGASPATR